MSESSQEAAGPFRQFSAHVRPEWVDYNGHMNDAAYAVVLSEANEVVLAALGLSAEYRERTGAALFTVETHLRYLAECSLGQELSATSTLLSAGERTLHVSTELLDDDGRTVATGETLYLHVDTELGKAVPMPADRRTAVEAMLAAHAALPRPGHLGRGITVSRSSQELSA